MKTKILKGQKRIFIMRGEKLLDCMCLIPPKGFISPGNAATLQEHQGWFFNDFFDFRKELCCDHTINGAVITGKAEVHAQTGKDLAVFDDGLFHNRADRENGRLRGIDNGVKRFDAPRSEIRHSERAIVELIRFEFFDFGTGGEIFDGS